MQLDLAAETKQRSHAKSGHPHLGKVGCTFCQNELGQCHARCACLEYLLCFFANPTLSEQTEAADLERSLALPLNLFWGPAPIPNQLTQLTLQLAPVHKLPKESFWGQKEHTL